MRHGASRVRHALTITSAVIAGVLLAYIIVACLLQIASRHTALPGVGIWEESARYALISMVFLGLPAVAGRTADVTIDLITYVKMPKIIHTVIGYVALAVSLSFLLLFAWGSYTWIQELQGSHQNTPSLHIPWELLPWPMVIGCLATAVVFVLTLFTPRSEVSQDHLTEAEGI